MCQVCQEEEVASQALRALGGFLITTLHQLKGAHHQPACLILLHVVSLAWRIHVAAVCCAAPPAWWGLRRVSYRQHMLG